MDQQEVLRYLGYRQQKIDAELEQTIQRCMARCVEIATPRYRYQTYDSSVGSDGVYLKAAGLLLEGEDLSQHLQGASQVVVMAATLGAAFDQQIIRAQSRSMTEALILDACGTDYIEKVCDAVCLEIERCARPKGLNVTSRFSPGYGDFPLEQQPALTALLDCPRQIGLTCSPSLILLPRKSVTAVVGLVSHTPADPSPACTLCALRGSCTLRKEGRTCGHQNMATTEKPGI